MIVTPLRTTSQFSCGMDGIRHVSPILPDPDPGKFGILRIGRKGLHLDACSIGRYATLDNHHAITHNTSVCHVNILSTEDGKRNSNIQPSGDIVI